MTLFALPYAASSSIDGHFQRLVLPVLTALLFCLSAPPVFADTSVEESARALWQGEFDGSDSIGINHATVHGPMSYAEVKVDYGFDYDGSSFLEIPSLEGFTGDNFTFHMWLQPEIVPGRTLTLFKIGHERGDTSIALLDDGSFCGRVQWRHGGCTFSTMKDLVRDNEMIHFAVSVFGNGMRLYKNGVLIGAGTGNCCNRFVGSVWFGSNGFGRSSYFGKLDEIQYHDRALTDEEIADVYNQLVLENPNPELEAELASAYQEIESLQQQILDLTDTNAGLETEIAALEDQQTITASQIFSLEEKIDELESQVDDLEIQVSDLEVRVSSLDEYIAILEEQINHLKSLVNGLETQVEQLEDRVNELQAELNALKQLLTLSLDKIESDFRETFNNSEFDIPGETPEEELESLVSAIIGLTKSQKIGLYEGLGGVYYQYQAYKKCSHSKYYSKYKKYDRYKKHHGYWTYKNYGQFVSYGKARYSKHSHSKHSHSKHGYSKHYYKWY